MLLITSSAYADEIDDATVACNSHLAPAQTGVPASQKKFWQDGWEHCKFIAAAKLKRDVDKTEANEAKNPELKRTRDLAKKLSNGELK